MSTSATERCTNTGNISGSTHAVRFLILILFINYYSLQTTSSETKCEFQFTPLDPEKFAHRYADESYKKIVEQVCLALNTFLQYF
jgi:hypothetical protein